jgi:hypothetical protein
MKAAKQWLLLFTLSSSLVAGACAYAADSAGLSNTLPASGGASGIRAYYPDQVTAPYTGTGTSAITFTAGSTTTSYFRSLPSCPLDASSSFQRSRQPACPDINNKWTAVPQGSNVKTGQTATSKDVQTYCPDVCQTSRNVVTSSFTASGQTIQQVTSYVPAVCPVGYVQVAATNPQPTVMDASQAGTTGLTTDYITSKTQLDSYINQGMQCYGVYTSPSDIYITTYCSNNDAAHANSCTANSSYSSITKTSAGIGSYTHADGSTYYGVTTACSTSPTYYYSSPADCVNKVAGQTVSGLLDSSYRARYANVFIRIKCKPTGLYLSTTSQEPATLICARVKSVWQKRE